MRLLFFLLSISAFSQFKITHYTSENGLPHDLCYQIIQDKQGFIWLGTDNGLTKFNGSVFQNFNRNQGLTNSFVIDVIEDGNQKLVATWGGGCYFFDGKTFRPILVKNSNFSKQQEIVKQNELIYSVENRYRINCYNTKTKKSNFYTLTTFGEKTLWYNNEVDFYKFNPNYKNLTKSDNLQIGKIEDQVYCFTDKNSPQFKGIYKLNENFKTEYAFPFLNKFEIIGLQKYQSNYIAITPDAIIQFNQYRILKIDKIKFSDKRILQYTANKFFKIYLLQNNKSNDQEIYIEDCLTNTTIHYDASFLKSPVSDLLISKDNSIWVSTYGNGLFLLQKPIIPLDKNILKGNYVFDFLEKPKFDFFLTENTLIATSKTNNAEVRFPIQTVAFFKNRENDTIYLAKKNGQKLLLKYENLIIKSIMIKNQIILNQQIIQHGDNELHYLKGGKFKKAIFKLSDNEILFFKIKKVLLFQNQYWIFSNYGIFIFNKDFVLIKSINQKNGLLQNEIVNAIIHKEKLYVLHYLGFTVFENQNIEKHKFINNENNTFNDFLITPKGNLWFASQKGLLLFKENTFLKFTKNEGLSSSFYSKLFLNSYNQIVALGNNGADFINADLEPSQITPDIIVYNKLLSRPLDKNTIIPYEKKFMLQAEIIGFQNSKPILEYSLNNQNWNRMNSNILDFSNFSSGKYTVQFRVKYPFANYLYSTRFPIDKEPIWFLKWHILIPGILTLFLAIGLLVYLRILQLNFRNKRLQNLLESNEKLQFQLNEMRQNIAQDFHDELGNKLAGISVLSDKLLRDEKLRTNVNYPIVEKIYKDSQDLFQGIRDFIWAIDSKNSTLEELIFALTDFGEDLFAYSNIKFIVRNEVKDAAFLLPNFWNRQILLLFKEAMTNAYKHSQATQLNLLFSLENDCLTITCQDNGIGFETAKLSRQNGLLNLQKRAAKIKSEVYIHSENGTNITFQGSILEKN